MSSVKGLVQLARPVNVILCAFSVICGGIIGIKPFDYIYNIFITIHNSSPSALRIALAACSASLILAAGNAFNDFCDLPGDCINAPHRPIPSGIVTPQTATIFSAMIAFTGIVLSLPLGIPGVAVAFLAVALLFAYNVKLKGIPLLGNMVVAFLGGLAFIYGGIAGHSVVPALIPGAFATLFHLGRELIKDAVDIEGDKSVGLSTAATVWGVTVACRLAAVVLCILAVVTALPFAAGYFGTVYFIIIVFGVWPALVYSVIVSFQGPSEKRLMTVSRVLKLAMPVGIVAVLVGFQGW